MFEQLVRPFQRPSTIATRRIVAHAEKVTVGAATLTWGVAGTIAGAQEIEELGVGFQVVTCDDQYDEVSRKVVEKRITNPDDENVYVDVERPTEIEFWKAGASAPNYNKTTTWTTGVQSAAFTTVTASNKACKAKFRLSVET